jgi:hypothetical protein
MYVYIVRFLFRAVLQAELSDSVAVNSGLRVRG